MKIVFVILHYLAMEETEESVKYIKKNIDIEEYHIVIVDNASPNNTGNVLKEKYKTDTNITVILNKTNMGFAKGNNVGFRHARDNLKAEFIILMNNDVLLMEKALYKKIKQEYLISNYSVLGPMILTADGKCNVNPQESPFNCAADIEKKIVDFKRAYRRAKFHYERVYLIFKKLSSILIKQNKCKNNDFIKRKENVKLHGCFWVFSPKYIFAFDGLDESTFLYLEEEFLYKHMKSNKHMTVYLPDIQVFHKEDASTDQAITEARRKNMFFYKNNILSLIELKKLYMFYDTKKVKNV